MSSDYPKPPFRTPQGRGYARNQTMRCAPPGLWARDQYHKGLGGQKLQRNEGPSLTAEDAGH